MWFSDFLDQVYNSPFWQFCLHCRHLRNISVWHTWEKGLRLKALRLGQAPPKCPVQKDSSQLTEKSSHRYDFKSYLTASPMTQVAIPCLFICWPVPAFSVPAVSVPSWGTLPNGVVCLRLICFQCHIQPRNYLFDQSKSHFLTRILKATYRLYFYK